MYRDWVAGYQCTLTGWPGVPRLGGGVSVYRDWVAACTVTGWPGVP